MGEKRERLGVEEQAYIAHVIYDGLGRFLNHHYKEFKKKRVESGGGTMLAYQVLTPKDLAERYAEQVVLSGFWIRDAKKTETNDYGDYKMVDDDDMLIPPSAIRKVRIEPIDKE